jgi:hypothetical protein
MFHGDASFVEIPQSAGRVYVLKFQSSDQRHFVRPNLTRKYLRLIHLIVLDAGIANFYVAHQVPNIYCRMLRLVKTRSLSAISIATLNLQGTCQFGI